jgi:hypothetical protein
MGKQIEWVNEWNEWNNRYINGTGRMKEVAEWIYLGSLAIDTHTSTHTSTHLLAQLSVDPSTHPFIYAHLGSGLALLRAL